MMTTALLIFLGLSTCATLAIVSAVVLGTRRSIPVDSSSPFETAMMTAHSGSQQAAFAPAYNH